MNLIIHKSTYWIKQTSITVLFVICSWFVYAGGNGGATAKVVKFYPNPATSFVNFELPNTVVDKSYTLQVFSFSGRKMTEVAITSNKITITLSNDFYRGIYVFQLKDKNGRIIESGKFQVVK